MAQDASSRLQLMGGSNRSLDRHMNVSNPGRADTPSASSTNAERSSTIASHASRRAISGP
jgi:hypothetical protein